MTILTLIKTTEKIQVKTSKEIKYLTYAGIIAALYVALTAVSALFGMSSGVIQLRLSEALCVLPVFSSAAVPGVTVGCLVSNLIFGGTVYDAVLGTLATLIGAVIARLLRRLPYLAPVPTVLSNAAVVPLVFVFSGIGGFEMYPYYALTVGLGEVVSCGVLGTLLTVAVKKNDRLGKLFK